MNVLRPREKTDRQLRLFVRRRVIRPGATGACEMRVVVWLACLLGSIAVGCTDRSGEPPPVVGSAAPVPLEQAIEKFCSECHARSAPDILPRFRWDPEVRLMYDLWEQKLAGEREDAPPMDDVIAWYSERAPERLPSILSTAKGPRGPVEFTHEPLRLPNWPPYPGVSHVNVVHLLSDRQPEILFCEMRFNRVLLLRPWEKSGRFVQIGTALHPSHAEVVDLDRDGRRDVLVACLGTPTPSDAEKGEVLWLRGTAAGKFERHVLDHRVGRVADARAADLDLDGSPDVLVAIFGWRKVGELVWLQNMGFENGVLRVRKFVIDKRHGPVSLAITDLNDDGKPDFLCLFAQEHETLSAFLNHGNGAFEERVLFTAPHPNWGSSSISLADLDSDGDEDILFANGDSLDDEVPKPYHRLQWLENRGGAEFAVHRLTDMSGAHAARAGDFDGDGDLDIVVSAFVPYLRPQTPDVDLAEPLVWLEQTAPGQFRRWPLESGPCFHPTLDVADLNGDGRVEFVVGNMSLGRKDGDDLEEWLTVWQNRGPRPAGGQAPESP